VVGGHEFGAFVCVEAPPEGGYPLLGPQEGLGGKGPEAADELWSDGLQLFEEEGKAGLDLIGSGIAVIRGAAFHDVGDVYLLSRQVYGLDDAGEELPRPADEGFALEVFFSAGSLSHKYECGMGIARAEDQVVSPFMEAAPGTLSQLLSDAVECQAFFPFTL